MASVVSMQCVCVCMGVCMCIKAPGPPYLCHENIQSSCPVRHTHTYAQPLLYFLCTISLFPLYSLLVPTSRALTPCYIPLRDRTLFLSVRHAGPTSPVNLHPVYTHVHTRIITQPNERVTTQCYVGEPRNFSTLWLDLSTRLSFG